MSDFKASTGFAFALDVVSGIGGMIVGAALLPFIASLGRHPRDQLWLAMFYCTLLPILASATPYGRPAGPRPLRPDQLAEHGDTDQPGDPGRDRLSRRRRLRGLCRGLVRHQSGGRAVRLVASRGGSLRRRGLLQGIRPTLGPTSLPGAWRFAIQSTSTPASRPLGTDRAPDRRRTARALPAPRCSGSPRASPTARASLPTCSPRPFIPK